MNWCIKRSKLKEYVTMSLFSNASSMKTSSNIQTSTADVIFDVSDAFYQFTNIIISRRSTDAPFFLFLSMGIFC